MSWFLPFQQAVRTLVLALLNIADRPFDQGTSRAMKPLGLWWL
jgi:hypothetical protein